jgi:uncharacterized protein
MSTIRQAFPDQLRGIALLGIIVVNAPFMAISAAGFTNASVATAFDRATAFLVIMLAQGKFYLLFSFLFGYSSLFLIKDNSRIQRRIYRRRLIALAILGVAHLVFFFVGDILVTYSILGFALLLLFARSDHTVWLTAGIVAAISAAWLFLLVLLTPFAPPSGDIAAFTAYDNAMATGSFLDDALARLQVLPIVAVSLIGVQWGYAFAAFCLGLLAARHRFLDTISNHHAIYRRMAIWGLALGLPLQFATAWLSMGPGVDVGLQASGPAQAAAILGILIAPLLSIGYLGVFGLLSWHRSRLLRPFGAPGRASLTIYLGESVLLTVIFAGWGLGLFSRLGAGAVTIIAIGIWATLAISLTLWQRRFTQGPLESLVRRWSHRPRASADAADTR